MVAPEPIFRPRGTPFSVLHRIRALVRLGHEVELVTYPFGETPDLRGLTVHRAYRPPGIRDVGIGPSLAKIVLDVPLFFTAYRLARRGGFDLLHTHEEAGIMGAWIARACGLPHLYDMHSSLPEQFANFGRFDWPPVVGAFRRLEAYTLSRADGVIAICPSLHDHVAEQAYDGALALIENCYDFEAPAVPDEEVETLRRRLELEGRLVVVYTGTLEPYQGLDLLLDAADRVRELVPTARFVILGGTPEQSGELGEAAARKGVASLFRFVPAVPPEEVFLYHRLATALVTTRIHGTNTPLKIYQYLRAGRPIVATAIPSHTQVLDPSSAELVEPEAASIAAGVARVLSDEARRGRLAEGAARLARERYSRDAYLARLEELLAALPVSENGRGTEAA